MTRKKWAVIKIQSNVRRMIAQRDYRRMRVERRARYVFTEKIDLKCPRKSYHCRFRFIYVVHKLVSRFMVDGQSRCFWAPTSIEAGYSRLLGYFFLFHSSVRSEFNFLKETHITQKMICRTFPVFSNIISYLAIDIPIYTYYRKTKEVFRTYNVLPFSCTHLALWRS